MNPTVGAWIGMGGVVLAAPLGPPAQPVASFSEEVLNAFPPEAGRNERFLMLVPGLGINPEAWADPADWADLVDQIPIPDRSFRASGQRCSDLTLKLLEQQISTRKSMALRQQVLDAKRIILDHRQPRGYTPAGAVYRDNQEAVVLATQKLITAKRKRRSDVPALEEALRVAKERLEKQAESSGIKKALETIRKAGAEDIRGRFEASREAMNAWMVRHKGRDTCLIQMSPDLDEWMTSPAWKAFDHASGGQEDPVLAFQGLRVDIHRPWLDEGLLEDRRWRLGPNFKPFKCYSTGDPDAADGAAMPMYISGLLVARNLRGSLGGNAVTSGSDPQIIGFFCRIVPPCPNPAPDAF